MSVVITCYEKNRDADRPDTPWGAVPHQLHRAISPEARFGYIDVSGPVDQDASRRAVQTVLAGSGHALAGAYEVLHTGDVAAAPFAVSGEPTSTRFINCMAFEPQDHDAAFAVWREINAYMVRKPGYRWHRLHRRTHDDAPFGLVNVVEWESPEAWKAAHDDGFRELAQRPDLPFAATATLCTPI